MKKYNEEIYELNKRITELKNLLVETKQNIMSLNVLISEHVAARDNERKKKLTTKENIDKLTTKLNRLTKANKQGGDK